MKIAVIFPGGPHAAWSVADGVGETFKRMGHEVIDIPRGRQGCPRVSVELLNSQDFILVTGPEHILENQELTFLRKQEVTLLEWRDEVKTPKAFWMHESFTREDRCWNFAPLVGLADRHFFPAWQDAEMYEQQAEGRVHWLPFGVDTDVFRPARCSSCVGTGRISPLWGKGSGEAGATCKNCLGSGIQPSMKSIDCGFIGLMYGKRQGFASQLVQHAKQGGPGIVVGMVSIIHDIEGVQWRESAERLAANYRRISIFLNMPHLSRLLVTKVYEVMACGTFMVTPALEGNTQENMTFENTKHLIYYRESNVPFLWQILREFAARKEQREQIALAGMYEVRKNHSLRLRLEQMLTTMGLMKAEEAAAQ